MASRISLKSRILGGLWGVAVGDALGVPVEFCQRAERERDPVNDLRGYGTYNQPPGTWSDDTSLTLCTVDTLLEHGDNFDALAKSFVRWLNAEIWTPHGEVFDVGIATQAAIRRYARGTPALQAGGDREQDNGNGSLMRILPAALWHAGEGASTTIEAAHQFSALTHRHPRSQVACGIYCLVAQRLLNDATGESAIRGAWNDAKAHYSAGPFKPELKTYARIDPPRDLARLAATELRASPYVVHALEASLWCLLNTKSFEDAVLKAVNLGEDTDTTAAITGGIAGISYGVDAIPGHWREGLARHTDLADLFERFAKKLLDQK
jgi:ADP-ribosyl-[dinitrogen reductase] hydrolase